MIPVIDIFAGPGGLGEGFTQAGFKVLLSAEMDPVACQTLLLRKFFNSFPRDRVPHSYYQFLRGELTLQTLSESCPEEWNAAKSEVVRAELGTEQGNSEFYRRLDRCLEGIKDFILIGGPPCQAYSLAGRSRMLGGGNEMGSLSEKQAKTLRSRLASDFYKDKRHTLYKEYIKILSRYQPSIFIMENVKGMGSAKTHASAVPGSVFDSICEGLRNPFATTNIKPVSQKKPRGYKLYSLDIDEKNLFPGDEISSASQCILKSEDYGVPQSRHRIIIVGIRSDISSRPPRLEKAVAPSTVEEAIGDMPALRSGLSKEVDNNENWRNALATQVQDALIGHTSIDRALTENLEKLRGDNDTLGRGGSFITSEKPTRQSTSNEIHNAIFDSKIGGFIQHETRGHIRSDLLRYFLVSTFGEVFGRSPKLSDWEGKFETLRPKHSNIVKTVAGLETRAHNDRFKVQVWEKPSSTIVSHIAKDGHYFIHPDPTQCRSLTVREAARLQTFPDNYYFCGNRTQQYHQVGNAVPVLLARKIATLIDSITD